MNDALYAMKSGRMISREGRLMPRLLRFESPLSLLNLSGYAAA